MDGRAFLRVMAEFPVGVTRLDAGYGEDAAFAATTVNICAGGAKMVARSRVTAGERLRLEVRFAQPPFLVFTTRPSRRWTKWAALAVRVRAAVRRPGHVHRAADRAVDLSRSSATSPIGALPSGCRWRSTRRVRAGGAAAAVGARTLDLAGDGARIVTDRALVPGDHVHIQLDVDEPAYRVACVAEVVWANLVGGRPVGLGLRFLGLDRPTQRQIVDHAIRERSGAAPRI